MEKIIKDKLKEIEIKENVKIIGAFESGSRAWGFASPDSDYDVRFIYVRNSKEYLKLEGIRDVIEWQLDDVFDINGWDIQKTLKLLMKSNPVIFEWCNSPIVYKSSNLLDEFKKLTGEYFSYKKSLFHYWHIAHNQFKDYLQKPEVKLKKYFYALRPILASKWIMDRKTPPPIEFDILAKNYLDSSIKADVEKLLKMKTTLSEMGTAPKVNTINDYIQKELEIIECVAKNAKDDRSTWDSLNNFFIDCLDI